MSHALIGGDETFTCNFQNLDPASLQEEAVMDWNAAIERNREALKRVLAMLVAMAGLGARGQFTFFPQQGAAASRLARAEKSKLSPCTLNRRSSCNRIFLSTPSPPMR